MRSKKELELKTSETVTGKTALYAKWQCHIRHKYYFCKANVDVAACYHGKPVLPGAEVLSWQQTFLSECFHVASLHL